MMAREEQNKLHELLVETTKEGRVGDWNERIANIAAYAGLTLSRIDWEGSPHMVAHRVVDYADRQGMLDALRRKLNA
jgi:predicted DsbA family dithiol-disulfide isomerase